MGCLDFPNTCMVQRTDASRKPTGEKTLDMKNDPDTEEPDRDLLS